MPVGIVIAVFVAFGVAQASAMWGGHAYLRRTTGLSYADYVHQGFGQLTVATVLTLATIALAVRKAPQRTGRDRLLLRIALGLLCLLTLGVVASALFRMAVYQQAFGYTVLRVLVDAFELLAGPARRAGDGGRRAVVRRVAAAGRARLGRGPPARRRPGQPRGVGGGAEHRPVPRRPARSTPPTSPASARTPSRPSSTASPRIWPRARCRAPAPVRTTCSAWNLGRARAAEASPVEAGGTGPASDVVDRAGCP